MNTNTTCPAGDEDDRHQFSGEKNDGTEPTVPSVEAHPVDENEATVRDEHISKEGTVDHETLDDRNTAPAAGGGSPFEGEAVEVGIRIPVGEVDLDAIAVDQNFAEMAAVKSEPAAPLIRKPSRQLWFSVHPDRRLWRSFLTIKDESDHNAVYVLNPSLARDLEGEYNKTLFVPCITRQAAVFFWPIKLPDAEGRTDSWNQSALELAVGDSGKWLRLQSNQFAKRYDKVTAKVELPSPTWPDHVPDLLKEAVSKTFIASMDHPLVKRLLGEDL